MPFHQPRAYILAMPPATECRRRGLDAAFGPERAEAFWGAWHQDLLPPLFADRDDDIRLAYGPRSAMAYYRPFVQRPGQLCFIPARNLAARWGRMVQTGLAATDKVIVAASDVPDLSPTLLTDLFAKLDDLDLVICRSQDDRFWCVAQRTWAPAVWEFDFSEQPPLPGLADHATQLGLRVQVTDSTEDIHGPEVVRTLRARLDAARFPKTLAALEAMGL